MTAKPNRDGTPSTSQARGSSGFLPPALSETLSDFALLSEKHDELSADLAQARRTLTSLVQRRPEFRGASSELLAKMAQLETLNRQAAKVTTQYSLAYEDVVLSAAGLDRGKAGAC